MAQNAEQYILNTHMYIEIMNVVRDKKKKRKWALSTQLNNTHCTGIDVYVQTHTHTHTHTHEHIQTLYRLLGRRTVLVS